MVCLAYLLVCADVNLEGPREYRLYNVSDLVWKLTIGLTEDGVQLVPDDPSKMDINTLVARVRQATGVEDIGSRTGDLIVYA